MAVVMLLAGQRTHGTGARDVEIRVEEDPEPVHPGRR